MPVQSSRHVEKVHPLPKFIYSVIMCALHEVYKMCIAYQPQVKQTVALRRPTLQQVVF